MITKPRRAAALAATLVAPLAATPALAGNTPPSAFAAAGVTGLSDLTGAPAAISTYEPVISGDGKVIALNLLVNPVAPSIDGTTGWTVDAANGWKQLARPGTMTDWWVRGINGDGTVIAGHAHNGTDFVAVFWKAGAATILPDLTAKKDSYAWGVSGDGRVVVGMSREGADYQPVRWSDGGAASKLTGGGFTSGEAHAASNDGAVIVGEGVTATRRREAFRWTAAGGLAGLGTLTGGATSTASAVSADGSVVVGTSFNANEQGQAFRWTQAGGMVALGALAGGSKSFATAVSADGGIVVGSGDTAGATGPTSTGFVWTQAAGMKSIADHLTGKSLTIAAGTVFYDVHAISADGSVLVGEAKIGGTDQVYIARTAASPAGGGTGVVGVTSFLGTVGESAGFQAGIASTATMALEGAHHRPLTDYGLPGGSCAWASGDLGGSGGPRRRQYFGELGLCHDLAPGLRVGFGAGYGHVRRDLPLGGRARANGYHLVGEVDLSPAGTPLTLSLTGLYANWNLHLARAYTNGAGTDLSTANPGAESWAIRTRIAWRDALKLGAIGLSPYASWTHSHTRIDAYAEAGGGFPVAVAESGRKGDESRLGLVAAAPLGSARLALTGEWVHRFDRGTFTVAGAMVGGLAPFAFTSAPLARDWGRAGLDLDIRTGRASVLAFSLHAVGGQGRDADVSGAVSFRIGF